MNSKRYMWLALAGALMASMPMALWADDSFTAEVLTKGAGARPLAMGGAFVAAANDATAAYWNPAGLGLIDDVEITTMHAAQWDIQSYDFLNIAFKTPAAGSYALSYLRLGTSDIPLTGPGGPGITGVASYAENAAYISGGWKLGKQFAVGATVKILKTDAYTASAFGYGADVGLLFRPSKQFSIGLAVRDFFGTRVQWSNTPTNPTQTLHPNGVLGISYIQELGKRESAGSSPVPMSTLSFNMDADVLYADKGLNNYRLGFEYWYRQFVAIRGGIQSEGLKFDSDSFTPSAGIGVWAYLFEIDYAFVNTPLGGVHYLSVITRL